MVWLTFKILMTTNLLNSVWSDFLHWQIFFKRTSFQRFYNQSQRIFMKTRKNIQFVCQKILYLCVKKTFKNFNTFIYDHILHQRRKHFCRYCLQAYFYTWVPENNGKLNADEPYTNKYQKHVACSFGYKLLCVDDKFSKPLSHT